MSIPRILFENSLAVLSDGDVREVSILIENGKISKIEKSGVSREKFTDILCLDMKDTLAFPGLINVHDHLYGTWSPRIGKGPYANSRLWQEEMFSNNDGQYGVKNSVARERPDLIYRLGVYRNIFSGVTTVLDHYPDRFRKKFTFIPLHLVTDFGQCHSLYWGNFWGGGELEEEFRKTEGKIPFVIHLAEGTDRESMFELDVLDEKGCLASNTILVHAVNLDRKALEKVRSRNARIVWCPFSNKFLLGAFADIKTALELGVPVAIGMDSATTGGDSMFEELRVARHEYRERYGENIDAEMLLDMVTTVAASHLMMDDTGKLAEGCRADILFLSLENTDLFQNSFSDSSSRRSLAAGYLIESSAASIALSLAGGLPLLSSERYSIIFEKTGTVCTKIYIEKKPFYVWEDPFAVVEEVSAIAGHKKSFSFLPFPH